MRKTPVKRVNRARRAKNHARAYGGKARIEFVKSLPCVIKGCVWSIPPAYPIENAHIETGGMGRKADADCVVPLCSPHHGSLHRNGRCSFEQHHRIDLSRAAAETERLWQEHLRSKE